MRICRSIGVLAVIAGWSPAVAQERLSQADLLLRVIDLNRFVAPPTEQSGVFSSTERSVPEGRNDDGRDFGHYLRREAGDWDVLAEVVGPGVLTRVWAERPDGELLIELDGQAAVRLPKFQSLFDGGFELVPEPLRSFSAQGAASCYFPLGFQKNAKVLARGCTSAYQINYARFGSQTTVATFDPQTFAGDTAAQAALTTVRAALTDGLSDQQLFGRKPAAPEGEQRDLKKGEKLIWTLSDAGTIRALYVALTDRRDPEPGALHQCVLRIYFDGAAEPAVAAPLCDFFGSGFDKAPVTALALGTRKLLPIPLPDRPVGDAHFMYCYFPMPFQTGARIELENLSAKKLGVMLYLRVDRTTPAADSLRFYARFRREDPCKGAAYRVLDSSGPGYFVGCTLSVDSPRRDWWGAGDDRIWIDDEAAPRYQGTGTGDFLGAALGLNGATGAFHGVTRRAAFGKNSGYRLFIHDSVAFRQSARVELENLQAGGARDVFYSSVAYWYAPPRARHPFKAVGLDELRVPGLRVPGAIEVEGNLLTPDAGSEVKQKYAGGVELSGEAAVRISTENPVSVRLPGTKAGVGRLKLRVHPRRPFESLDVHNADGQMIGTATYARSADGWYEIGPVRLADGETILNVTARKNPVLDCWVIEPGAAAPPMTQPAPRTKP